MWSSVIDGRTLHFRLIGINNQNFLMKDQETGSIWQQVSGKAIFGTLKGRSLDPIYTDELTLEQWSKEKPHGRVLKPDPAITDPEMYTSKWEEEVLKFPVLTKADKMLPQRELILGVQIGGVAKAYPQKALTPEQPIIDRIGSSSIILLMANDGQSVRVFDTSVDGKRLELFAKQGAAEPTLVDSTTGSEWGFDGVAHTGPLAGRKLNRIPLLKDYWFDWKNYHPDTLLYGAH